MEHPWRTLCPLTLPLLIILRRPAAHHPPAITGATRIRAYSRVLHRRCNPSAATPPARCVRVAHPPAISILFPLSFSSSFLYLVLTLWYHIISTLDTRANTSPKRGSDGGPSYQRSPGESRARGSSYPRAPYPERVPIFSLRCEKCRAHTKVTIRHVCLRPSIGAPPLFFTPRLYPSIARNTR